MTRKPSQPIASGPLSENERRFLPESLWERLRRAEVNVPKIWRQGTNPRSFRFNDCFRQAFKYMMAIGLRVEDHRDIWLVHGTHYWYAKHAWVEIPKDIVFDGVLQRCAAGPESSTAMTLRSSLQAPFPRAMPLTGFTT